MPQANPDAYEVDYLITPELEQALLTFAISGRSRIFPLSGMLTSRMNWNSVCTKWSVQVRSTCDRSARYSGRLGFRVQEVFSIETDPSE